MRQLANRKWLVTHVLAVGMIVLFVFLGTWQLHRAQGGNTRSYAYALEWPTFALLVIGFWIKLVHDELRPKRKPADAVVGGMDSGSRTVKVRSDRAVAAAQARARDAAELAAYNRYLAERVRQADPSR